RRRPALEEAAQIAFADGGTLGCIQHAVVGFELGVLRLAVAAAATVHLGGPTRGHSRLAVLVRPWAFCVRSSGFDCPDLVAFLHPTASARELRHRCRIPALFSCHGELCDLVWRRLLRTSLSRAGDPSAHGSLGVGAGMGGTQFTLSTVWDDVGLWLVAWDQRGRLHRLLPIVSVEAVHFNMESASYGSRWGCAVAAGILIRIVVVIGIPLSSKE